MFDLFEWDDSDQDSKYFEDEYEGWWQQDERDLDSPDYDEDEGDQDIGGDDLLDSMSYPIFESLLDSDWSPEE